MSVLDWVTGERLWYAHLLNKKPKKDEGEIPAGPHTDIYTRGMTTDQIAMKLTTKLREYVSELEKGGSGQPAAGTSKQ